jgi:hypothetical protein
MSQSWLGLAQAQEAMGASDAEVAASIVRALRIGAQQPSILFAAGNLYDRLGMTGRADRLYAETLVRYPSLAADPYWSRDDLPARFEGILARAAEHAPEAAWEIALMAGDSERARDLEEGDATAAPIVEAWLGDPEAQAAVYAMADGTPVYASLLSWGSRIARQAGDIERADRYQRLAVFEVTEGGELPGTEIGVDEDGYLDLVPAGTEVGYAGHYLYRRPLVLDLLPPGLPRLVFGQGEDDDLS